MSVVEASVVIPCLNEEATIGVCVGKAVEGLRQAGVAGEVVVADNGSTDRSAAIARDGGARVVPCAARGYGAALKCGIGAAQGRWLVMGDADDTYDFLQLPCLLEPLRRNAADLVMGSRLRGGLRPGAMPWLHRWVGTPVMTWLLNRFYGTRISDVNCGMRAFTADAARRMSLQCDGMEFASEMVIKAARARLRIVEVPIDYHPAVKARKAKLRTFRDGWRHLRFMLVLCPQWLFVIPGLLLAVVGLACSAVLFSGSVTIGGVPLGLSAALATCALVLVGLQVAFFGVFAEAMTASWGLGAGDPVSGWLRRRFTLERGILTGALVMAAGLLLGGVALARLLAVSQPGAPVNVPVTKLAIASVTCVLLGIQVVSASFLLSLFDLAAPRQPKAE
jgi:hypothetical protein